MRFLFTVVVLMLFCVPCVADQPAAGFRSSVPDEVDEDTVHKISEMIRFQMRKCPGKRLSKDPEYRLGLAYDIVQVANEGNQIPEQLFTMLLFQESTFRMNVVGLKKEKGMGQVMNPQKYGCDMSTRLGQIRCSADFLRRGYKKCGTWYGALSHYQSMYGACKPKPGSVHERKVDFRMNRWVRLRRKFPIDKPI